MKLIKGIPMNRFPYKIFLDRYAQKDLSKPNLNSVEYEQKGIEQTLLECPSCKRHTLRKTEGCYSCTHCGYSKCE